MIRVECRAPNRFPDFYRWPRHHHLKLNFSPKSCAAVDMVSKRTQSPRITSRKLTIASSLPATALLSLQLRFTQPRPDLLHSVVT